MRPEPEDIRRLFDYDRETGQLFRRGKHGVLRPAGWQNGDGAIRVDINNRKYLVHVVIWAWMTGKWPNQRIDHKDRCRWHNWWDNLREATQSQNLANAGISSRNTSGLKRVSWAKRERKWQVHICVEKKQQFLGYYDCPAAGHFQYQIAADMAFGEFARPF